MMLRIRSAVALLLAAFLLLVGGQAQASLFLKGSRGASVADSCILTVSCGATADAGQTDDPRDAAPYNSGTYYAEGAIVSNGGNYFYSKAAFNRNNATSDTIWWWQISTIYYVDSSTGGNCTGSTNPVTAAASPCSMARAYDLLATGGSVTAPNLSLMVFNRGQTHDGSLTISNASSAYILGAYGTGARPKLRFANLTASYFTGAVVDITVAGTTLRNLDLNPRYVTDYPVSTVTGTFVDGDVVTKQVDGTVQATVANGINGTVISVIHDVKNQFYSTGNVIQTAGGAKLATVTSGGNSRTPIHGLSAKADDIRVINCAIYEAEGNGISLGTNAVPGSADRFYLYNSSIYLTIKWGGNGGGIQGGWGTGQKFLWNTFYDNGASTGSHNVYLEDLDTLEFGHNYSYMSSTSAHGNHCLVVHGAVTGFDAHDNDFNRCRNGVGFNDGYFAASVEYMEQITFTRNVIRNMGLDSIPSDGLILDLSILRNSVISNNFAFGNTGVVILGDFSHTGAPNLPSTNVLFAYNTFVSDTNQGNGNYFFIITGASVTAVTVTNNVLVSKRSTLATFRRAPTTPATEVSLTYNDIFNTTGRNGVINWADTNYETQTGGASADFSGATNGNATNWQNDPGTVTAITTGSTESTISGLLLNGSSFARNIGSPNGTVTQDVYRRTRNAATPSAGAFEYVH